MTYQWFRLRRTPVRKPAFCKDFCEGGRAHNIAIKHGNKALLAALPELLKGASRRFA
jgi:hypothetical protein